MAIRYRNDDSRHPHLEKPSTGIASRPAAIHRCVFLRVESLKIHVDDNVNLAGKDIRFRGERETIAMFNDFEEHFAETFFV